MTTSTRIRLALVSMGALLVVHLLDSLRTDPEATFPGVLLAPQAVLGIGGTVLALALEVRGDRRARPVAVTVAALVAIGFVVVHGVPVASARTEPYWGDGSADVYQWVGVSAVVLAAAATITTARRPVRSAASAR
jgi:cytochrome bd-type quinol oxidase subunit 2